MSEFLSVHRGSKITLSFIHSGASVIVECLRGVMVLFTLSMP